MRVATELTIQDPYTNYAELRRRRSQLIQGLVGSQVVLSRELPRVLCAADLPQVRLTLDRSKADTARSLVGAASTSEIIHLALDRIIRAERLRRDLAAYRRVPPTDAELELALLAQTAALDDDTDWAALYADDAQ